MPIDWRRYPRDWPAIRARVLERAGYRCEACGLPDGSLAVREPDGRYREVDPELAEALWDDGERVIRIVLTVAHLDHDPQNNDLANLRAWCQPCHLRYDADLHRKHAAETRRRRKVEAGQLELGV